jgi:hypothetical protein
MTRYDPNILRKYKISNGRIIFKLINLPDDIKNHFSGIYTNIPLSMEEIELVFDSLRDEIFGKSLFDQYLLILSDPNEYVMDIVSFCPICVYKKIFSLGIHPENCSNSQIAEAVILKYSDFISNGYKHDH